MNTRIDLIQALTKAAHRLLTNEGEDPGGEIQPEDCQKVRSYLAPTMGTTQGAATLVRFACGCKGVRVSPTEAWVIWSCDQTDYDEYSIGPREDCVDKAYTPLSPAEVIRVLSDLRSLVRDGYRFSQVRSALGVPNE